MRAVCACGGAACVRAHLAQAASDWLLLLKLVRLSHLLGVRDKGSIASAGWVHPGAVRFVKVLILYVGVPQPWPRPKPAANPAWQKGAPRLTGPLPV